MKSLNTLKNDIDTPIDIRFFVMRKNRCSFKIYVGKNIKTVEVFIRSRKNPSRIIKCSNIKVQNNFVKCDIAFKYLCPEDLYYDFYIKYINHKGILQEKKLKSKKKSKNYVNNLILNNTKNLLQDGKKYIVTIYFTGAGNLALQIRKRDKYDSSIYRLKEFIALLTFPFVYWYYKESKITYEKYCKYARDNSFYYFQYVQKKSIDNSLYFIINKDSKDVGKISFYKNRIVYFMSIKHFILIFCSKYIISSESKGHAYAWRHNQSITRYILNRKPFVFLQHGVLGLKKIDNTFYANNKLNHADLFITSSDFEKKIVQRYLGYDEDKVAITGLARWDSDIKIIKEKKIFIMPTWRIQLELLSDKDFLKSTFYQVYSKFLNSNILEYILKNNNYSIHFMLHPKFIRFEKYFVSENSNIEILYQKDMSIDKEIKTSSLIITDYSSITWDALYYDIPVVLFQFDQEDYLKLQGSYLDLKKELNELIIYSMDDLIDFIILFIKDEGNNSKVGAILEKKEYYFKYHDQQNAIRIQNAIDLWEKDFIFENLYQKILKKFCKKLLKRKVTK